MNRVTEIYKITDPMLRRYIEAIAKQINEQAEEIERLQGELNE